MAEWLNCATSIPWNATVQQKGNTFNAHILDRFKGNMLREKANLKKLYTVWFHLYYILKNDKIIELVWWGGGEYYNKVAWEKSL